MATTTKKQLFSDSDEVEMSESAQPAAAVIIEALPQDLEPLPENSISYGEVEERCAPRKSQQHWAGFLAVKPEAKELDACFFMREQYRRESIRLYLFSIQSLGPVQRQIALEGLRCLLGLNPDFSLKETQTWGGVPYGPNRRWYDIVQPAGEPEDLMRDPMRIPRCADGSVSRMLIARGGLSRLDLARMVRDDERREWQSWSGGRPLVGLHELVFHRLHRAGFRVLVGISGKHTFNLDEVVAMTEDLFINLQMEREGDPPFVWHRLYWINLLLLSEAQYDGMRAALNKAALSSARKGADFVRGWPELVSAAAASSMNGMMKVAWEAEVRSICSRVCGVCCFGSGIMFHV